MLRRRRGWVLRMLISWLQVHRINPRRSILSFHNLSTFRRLRRKSLLHLRKRFCQTISSLYTSHLPQNQSSLSLPPPPRRRSRKSPPRSRPSNFLPPSQLASPRTSRNPPRRTNPQIKRLCCSPRPRNLKRRNGTG